MSGRSRAVWAGIVPAAALALAACSSGGGNAAAPVESANAAENAASAAPATTGRLADAIRANRPVEIGVFGDSFSDGIWFALNEEYKGGNVAKAHRLGQASTGFANYTTVNLLDDMRRKLDAKPVDVALIIFGANDTQPLHGADQPTPFMSDGWKQVVSGRIEAMVNLLRERNVTIVWVGLPKMRRPDYEDRTARLNAFYESEMRRLNVPYLETVSVTSDANGNYVENLPGPDGKARPARARDGIHMSMSGYKVLAGPFINRLRTMIDETRRAVALPG